MKSLYNRLEATPMEYTHASKCKYIVIASSLVDCDVYNQGAHCLLNGAPIVYSGAVAPW